MRLFIASVFPWLCFQQSDRRRNLSQDFRRIKIEIDAAQIVSVVRVWQIYGRAGLVFGVLMAKTFSLSNQDL